MKWRSHNLNTIRNKKVIVIPVWNSRRCEFPHVSLICAARRRLLLRRLPGYSQTSLIRTPKGPSKVSVLERCPYKRGHYHDVTFMTPLTVLSVQSLKPRLPLVFKLHLNLLIHNAKTLSCSSIQHCTSQLQSKYSRRQITILKRNELQFNSARQKLERKARLNSQSVFRYFASAIDSN